MKYVKTFESFLNEKLNEGLPEGIVRVFRTKDMKDYIKDVPVDEIKERGKDLKVRSSLFGSSQYIVNLVILNDGTKGWVWSENEDFKWKSSSKRVR